MAASHVMILHDGGLRGLVATALVVGEWTRQRVSLLTIADGRPGMSVRREHARQQADHFGIKQRIELDLPHLTGPGTEETGGAIGSTMTLARPQQLLAALARAQREAAQRLIWPIACHGQTEGATRATEQIMLATQLAEMEGVVLDLEAPLLELTDQQVVELGGQMEAPWSLARTCELEETLPCRVCGPCRRRKLAFEKAGLADA